MELFKTKKDLLYEFINKNGRCRTSDVIRWGSENYYNRADRTARDLAEEGKIWRVRDEIARILCGDTKEEFWSVYLSDK
jgi:hypothetical protein